jgi:hypothetical protein
MIQLEPDMRVDVHFGQTILPGRITKFVRTRERSYKVVFDDPLVYGGSGAGWFPREMVALPGQLPEEVPDDR